MTTDLIADHKAGRLEATYVLRLAIQVGRQQHDRRAERHHYQQLRMATTRMHIGSVKLQFLLILSVHTIHLKTPNGTIKITINPYSTLRRSVSLYANSKTKMLFYGWHVVKLNRRCLRPGNDNKKEGRPRLSRVVQCSQQTPHTLLAGVSSSARARARAREHARKRTRCVSLS